MGRVEDWRSGELGGASEGEYSTEGEVVLLR